MKSSRDDLIGFVLALVIGLGTVVLANILPASRVGEAPSTPSSFDLEPTCAEWTDGCVVCQRGDKGPACSTPGIACVPQKQQCLRREGA